MEKLSLFSLTKTNEKNFLLELDEFGNPSIQSDELLRIPRNSKLLVKLYNGSKVSKSVFMITNANEADGEETTIDQIKSELVKGSSYFEKLVKLGRESKILKVQPDRVDTSIYFSLNLEKSGPIFFTLCYENEEVLKDTISIPLTPTTPRKSFERLYSFERKPSMSKSINTIGPTHSLTKEVYILVEPRVEMNDQVLDLDSFSVQTVLSKSLGKYYEWEKLFKEACLLSKYVI